MFMDTQFADIIATGHVVIYLDVTATTATLLSRDSKLLGAQVEFA